VFVHVERIHMDAAHGPVILHQLRHPLQPVVRKLMRTAAQIIARGDEHHAGLSRIGYSQ
jgi:hypothetical protein